MSLDGSAVVVVFGEVFGERFEERALLWVVDEIAYAGFIHCVCVCVCWRWARR